MNKEEEIIIKIQSHEKEPMEQIKMETSKVKTQRVQR
jgi:hypothetical protein